MLKSFRGCPLVSLFAVLALISFSKPSAGQLIDPVIHPVTAAAALPTPAPEPLTVTDVVVDKTATNAVIARDQAITEAQRLAFQRLAQRNMAPEAFTDFKMPENKDIALLVQDFEIRSEQLSATRYVGNFTIRFRNDVNNYFTIATPQTATAEIPATAPPVQMPATQQAQLQGAVLILPYFEDISGKTLLWEDPNPWRQAWQHASSGPFIVPLGDISDISAGSTDAVWTGNNATLEKLRQNYAADEVILPVANKSGPYLSINLFSYKDGKFHRLVSLDPYVGEAAEADAFRQGVAAVLRYLQKPDLDPEPQAVSITLPAPVETAGRTELQATMNFDKVSTWMEAQKRLSRIVPPVTIGIKALRKGAAAFTMTYSGDITTLRQVLAQNGIALNLPSVEIDTSTLGADAGIRKPVYDIRLAN